MTKLLKISATTALLLAAALPLSAQTGLTIYNSGRVLVRRTLPVAVPKGASEQRVNLGTLDPATIFPLDPAVSLLAATYDGGTDQGSTLRRAVGRELTFVRAPGDSVRATLLAVDPERFRYADGTIGFQAPGMPRFPADVVIVEPTVKLSLTSTKVAAVARAGVLHEWRQLAGELPGDPRREGRAGAGQRRDCRQAHSDVADAELQLLAGDVGSCSRKQGGAMARRRDAAPGVVYEDDRNGGATHWRGAPLFHPRSCRRSARARHLARGALRADDRPGGEATGGPVGHFRTGVGCRSTATSRMYQWR